MAMMTTFMLKRKHVQNKKYTKNMEHLVQENMLEKNTTDQFVYSERGRDTYVVVEKTKNGFVCTLVVQTKTIVAFDVTKEHPLFEKIDEDYRIWESIEQEETQEQLHGLSKNQQAKYKKLAAGSM